MLAILLDISSAADMAESIQRADACANSACVCEQTPWRAECQAGRDLPAIPQDVVQCSRQPGLPWCVAACEKGNWEWCSGIPLAQALAIEAFIRPRFTFQNERTDHWDSQAEAILAGQEAVGDCDTYAATVLHVLSMSGGRSEQLGRALVSMSGAKGADHQVALAEFNGVVWIIADSLAVPQPLGQSGYEIRWTQRLSEGLEWTNEP